MIGGGVTRSVLARSMVRDVRCVTMRSATRFYADLYTSYWGLPREPRSSYAGSTLD